MSSLFSLVKSAQLGNDNAKNQLYKDSCNKAYYTIYMLVNNDELVQQAMTSLYYRVYTEIGVLEKPLQFRTWFVKLLIDESLRVYKGISQEPFGSGFAPKDGEDGATLRVDRSEKIELEPPEFLIDKIKNTTHMEILNSGLNNEQKFCLVLYYAFGMSVAEIAEGVACPIAAIKNMLSYALFTIDENAEKLEPGAIAAGVRSRDFYQETLISTISGVWYLSQNVSKNVLTGVITEVNRAKMDMYEDSIDDTVVGLTREDDEIPPDFDEKGGLWDTRADASKSTAKASSGSNGKIVAVVIIILVLIGAGVGLWYFVSHRGKDNDVAEKATEVTVPGGIEVPGDIAIPDIKDKTEDKTESSTIADETENDKHEDESANDAKQDDAEKADVENNQDVTESKDADEEVTESKDTDGDKEATESEDVDGDKEADDSNSGSENNSSNPKN